MRPLLIVALLLCPRPAVAAEPEPTMAAELRLGVQGTRSRPGPAVGAYVATRLGDGWSAGGGYELVRIFEGALGTGRYRPAATTSVSASAATPRRGQVTTRRSRASV